MRAGSSVRTVGLFTLDRQIAIPLSRFSEFKASHYKSTRVSEKRFVYSTLANPLLKREPLTIQ